MSPTSPTETDARWAGALARHLEEFEEACPSCGYSLRGLREGRCPECSQGLVLRVGLAEPRLGWFITGLVGIAMGLGFSGLLTAYMAYWTVMRAMGPPWEITVPLVTGTGVGSGLLGGWLKGRRGLARWSAGRRWVLAGVAGVAAMACPVWFIVTVK